jgi:hypothetical protein
MNLLYCETAFWGSWRGTRTDRVNKAYRCGQVI